MEVDKWFAALGAIALAGLAGLGLGLDAPARSMLAASSLLLLARFIYGLRRGKFTVDLLMAVVGLVTFYYGMVFEGLIVMALYALAETIEEAVEGVARRRLESAARLIPRYAVRLRDGAQERVPVEDLEPGDIILVPLGAAVPVDSIAIDPGMVDESVVTGEPVPVRVEPGTLLRSGSIVVEGPIRARVARRAEESFVQRLVEEAREALEEKPRLARRVERLAPHITLLVLASYAIAHLALGPHRALAILLTGCPSAFIIASSFQASYSVALLAARGVLVRGGWVLEALGEVDTYVLDKTGTLTRLAPRLIQGPGEHVGLVAAAAQASRHPVSRALATLPARGTVTEAREIPGVGVEAVVEGVRVTIGRGPRDPCGPTVEARVDGSRLVFCLEEQPAPGARELVEYLYSTGRRVIIASGDRPENVERVARLLGIREYYGGLKPEDKARLIERLTREGHRVAYAGDGVNDAIALAKAHVGIAVGDLDVAREAGDAVVQGPTHLHALARAGDAYKRGVEAAFATAGAVKAAVAVLGLAGTLPLPLVALLGDDGSTLAAVAAGALLAGARIKAAARPPRRGAEGAPHNSGPQSQ